MPSLYAPGAPQLVLVTSGVNFNSPARSVGSAIFGWAYGRVCRLSRGHGLLAVPSHIATYDLLVDAYSAGNGTPGSAYIQASYRDTSGTLCYFGGGVKPRQANTHNRWWPLDNDWPLGVPIVMYPKMVTSAGTTTLRSATSTGQWRYCAGRHQSIPRRFLLDQPFDVAPSAGDVFAIGPQVFWVVWGIDAPPPFGDHQSYEKVKLIVRQIEGTTRMWVETYRGGHHFEIDPGTFPLQPSLLQSRIELNATMLRVPASYDSPVAASGGVGQPDVEAAHALVELVRNGQEFSLVEFATEGTNSTGAMPQ